MYARRNFVHLLCLWYWWQEFTRLRALYWMSELTESFSEYCLISDMNVKNLRLQTDTSNCLRSEFQKMVPRFIASLLTDKTLYKQEKNRIEKLECVSVWSFEVLRGETTQIKFSCRVTRCRSIDSYQNIGWVFCHNLEDGEDFTLKRRTANFRKSLVPYLPNYTLYHTLWWQFAYVT